MDRFDRSASLGSLHRCGVFGHTTFSSLVMASPPPCKAARRAYLLLEVPTSSDRSELDFSTGSLVSLTSVFRKQSAVYSLCATDVLACLHGSSLQCVLACLHGFDVLQILFQHSGV